MFKQLKAALMDLFEWLGDINLDERSHVLIPIEREREPPQRRDPARH